MGSFVLMASVIVSKAAGLLMKIPLANLLGGTGMGYYSGAYGVFMPFYALCAGSLPPAVASLVSENNALGKTRLADKTKRTALIFFSTASLIMTLIPLLFAGFISSRIIGNPEAKLSVMAISPCIFFGTVTAVYRGYYEGLHNMTPTSVSQMIDAVVKLISGLGFAVLVKGYARDRFQSGMPVFGQLCLNEYEAAAASLPYIAAAAVLGTAVSDLAAMLYLMLNSGLHKKAPAPKSEPLLCHDNGESARLLKRLLSMIAPIAAASLVASLLGTIDLSTIISMIKLSLRRHPELYIEKYSGIIGSGVSLNELPNFLYGSFTGLSMAIFGLAPSLCAVFGKSAFPGIAENHAKGDKAAVSKEIKRAVLLSLYISIPAGLGLAAFSKPILSVLFSSRYAEISVSYIPLSILAISTPFLSVFGSCCTMLQAIGRADIPVKISLAGAVIKLGLNTLLIPYKQSGLPGASMATVISYAIMCIWSAAVLYRLTSTRPQLFSAVGAPLFCGCASVGAAYYLYQRLMASVSTLLVLALSVFFAVIFYILLLIALDISNKNTFSAHFFDR